MIILREIRCPKCNKKLAEHMEEGLLVIKCRCGAEVILDRRIQPRIG